MKTNSDISVKSQIRSLLLVIGSAIFLALIVAVMMVMHYDTSKIYPLNDVLLSPQSTEALLSKSLIALPFDYSTWDFNAKRWKPHAVNLPAYSEFYSEIEKDKSLDPVPNSIEALFNGTNLSTLTLYNPSKKDPVSSQDKEFQRVQFAKGSDYYRVELHMSIIDSGFNWAYFYHPSIDQLSRRLFEGNGL